MLMKCKERGNQVSDKVRSCPHCGAPVGPEDNRILRYFETRARFGIKIARAMIIVGLLLFLPAMLVGWEYALIAFGIFVVPGIMGVLVGYVRLSQIEQSKQGETDATRSRNDIK